MSTCPAWCEDFLAHMREMARRHGRCNAKRAAEFTGVHRGWVYRYRESAHGSEFRVEWDRILLEAQAVHDRRRRKHSDT